LAGDNLIVDFDLSVDHVVPGTRIYVGDAVLEITAQDHSACRKFLARYGADAANFVNSDAGHRHNLRGLYARIVKGATVRVGDKVRKI
jgi:MOSC domain-containing protein YiiM